MNNETMQDFYKEQNDKNTIGAMRSMPTGEGDWGRIPTIGEVEGWGGEIEDW